MVSVRARPEHECARMESRDYLDYEVIDVEGERLGPVTGLWLDNATGRPEFASVKTGWILGRHHVVPIREDAIDPSNRTLRVAYRRESIRDAPSFDSDHELSPEEEQRIYDHYGLARSETHGRLGAWHGESTAPGTTAAGDMAAGRDEAIIPLHEERLQVGKRQVEDGGVRLRKIVKTETVHEPVELRREHIEVERIPASELHATEGRGRAFEEDEVVMRERHEEPVIEKRDEVVGGVRAYRVEDVERRDVEAEIRKEDVEIDRDTKKGL